MPVIQLSDGRVIAWSGIQAGPIQEYEPHGRESPWVRYEAEVGTGAPETAKIVVRVEKSWRKEIPQIFLTSETAEQQAVIRFLEEYVTGNHQPLENGTTNNFSLQTQEMLRLYRKQ
jgi:hypothetical protein